MTDIRARILANEKVGTGYFKMVLHAPEIAKTARSGQFVQVKCSDGFDPLLRRPLGIYRLLQGSTPYHRGTGHGFKVQGIELLYEVVGKGTTLLSKKQKGESTDILGPLGNGFTIPDNSSCAVLVAGGIGVAPLLFLAEELKRQRVKTTVLIGAKTKREILCEQDFKKLSADVHTATDDGSHGCKGHVSDLLKQFLFQVPSFKFQVLYACGPHPMLRCIAELCKNKNIECQISLEEKMACGIGVCLGCAVKVKKGKGFIYKMACKDGPIFKADEIIWE